MGERSVARPRELRALSIAGAAVASTFCVQRNPTMPLIVLEARMWSVSVVVGVGVPLWARTVLEMVHLDGRVDWRARELRVLSEVLLRASLCAKGSRVVRLCVFKHVCRALLRF
jgi:hypothetical protein